MQSINWETIGVILTLLGLGGSALWKLSSLTTLLAALKEQMGRRHDEDRADHADFRRTLRQQGVQLADHEHRIVMLETEAASE